MNEVSTEPFVSNIVAEAGEQVLHLYNKHQNTRLLLHNYAFAQSLVKQCAEIGAAAGASNESIEMTQLAAWFLKTGLLFDYENYLKHSLDQAQRFLALRDYPEEGQRTILRIIQTIGNQNNPQTLEEKNLADALSILTWIERFEEQSPLMRLEEEFMGQRTFNKKDWATKQLQELLDVKLYTHFAKIKYEPILAQRISNQTRAVEKTERNKNNVEPKPVIEDLRRFQDLDDSPIRAVQTFFRANYRNHINLSAIADNKANIMISVNSILISVLISILSYRNMAETQPQVVLPVIIFLVTGLASLIFAVLSARPKVTTLNHPQMSKEEKRRNIVFFGNFVALDLDEYEEAMDAMFRDGELMYGNLVRDLYYLGKVLDKKYRYLTVSYNIFMIGFVATVTTFIITLFL
ncbi:MAG: DUF5706 domain-containing protein [Saprospiraceae bacterium]|nr:DUF5706 domain-containing protein [Saprospiraceae bacterium]